MNYMGIDHHKQYSHITMLNEKGKKLKYGRVANYRSELLYLQYYTEQTYPVNKKSARNREFQYRPLRMTLTIYPAHGRDCDSRNTPKWLAALYSPVSS